MGYYETNTTNDREADPHRFHGLGRIVRFLSRDTLVYFAFMLLISFNVIVNLLGGLSAFCFGLICTAATYADEKQNEKDRKQSHPMPKTKGFHVQMSRADMAEVFLATPSNAMPNAKYSAVAPMSGTFDVIETKSMLTCDPALIPLPWPAPSRLSNAI
jgi:hypothetical protein